jgi:tripartite ATP-independent transporter DctP family solute receptor
MVKLPIRKSAKIGIHMEGNKVKKKWISVLLSVAMVATLAACGQEAAPTASSKEPAAEVSQAAPEASVADAPAAAATTDVEPEFVFTYAENQAEDYPTTQGGYRFAELVKERTNGRIEIVMQAGGVLGDEKSVAEQLQFGGIDFMRMSLSPLSEFVPELNVLQMPYLYTGAEHMWKVLDGEIGNKFFEFFEGSNLVPLSWYDSGARNFYFRNAEVTKLSDLAGMKIRVQESALMMGMIEALGASPTPMTYAEVYSGLQTGIIDAAENNWPSYESTSHYEVAPYFLIDEHTRVPELQLVSQITWDKLSAEDQEIIRQAALESAVYQRELWAEREKTAEEKVRAMGSTITELPAEEKAKFKEAMAPLYEEFAGDHMDILNEIIAAGE